MNRYSDEFLVDIARLSATHGIDQLIKFSVDLSKPDGQRDLLIEDLERVKSAASEPLDRMIANLAEPDSAEAAPEEQTSASPKNAASKRKNAASGSGLYGDIAIPELRAADSRGVRMFREMLNTLTTSDLFQRRRVLLELAGKLNVPVAKSDNRKRMMEKIVSRLAGMDTDQLAQARVCVRKSDRGSTETFMRFGTFIANGARPSGSPSAQRATAPEAVEII